MISMVIGSWGSYNACNERALGSKWLYLDEYSDWEEIVEELKREGFVLDGIDEELFVQDIEGIPNDAMKWDDTNPKDLFETLKESGVLEDIDKNEIFEAFLEVRSWNEFEDLVAQHGDRWDNDINLYRHYSWDDYGREMFDMYDHNLPKQLENFFDFEEYGKYMGEEYAAEYSNGIIEIRY